MTFTDAPLDSEAASRLEAAGLRLGLVDTSDPEAFAAWLQADTRGFHGPRLSQERIDEQLRDAAYRRTTGVWDDTAEDPAGPVATVSTWPTPLTVPGERSVPAWAISSVTVSPTHRRRGIARALLEAELRTAHGQNVPLAILTVSEATIYGRYGFGPAAMSADLEIDTRRTRWAGPDATGRVHFVSLEHVRDECRAVHERTRLRIPGEIPFDDALWNEWIGLVADDEETKHLRAVRYDDAGGVPQGFALYRVKEKEGDFAGHKATIRYLCAASDDAAAGLWRFFLELDLVGTVAAPLRAVDDPVVWQLSDIRAVRTTEHRDHLWARILDVRSALEARTYGTPGRIILDLSDPLGFSEGPVLLTVDADGSGHVSPAADASADTPGLSLDIKDLATPYLGGVSAVTLARAGRVAELRPGSAEAFDASFRTRVAPWLSFWF